MSWKTLFLHLKCLVVYQRIKEEHFNTNCISQEPAFSVTVHRRTHGKFLQVKIHRSISSPPSWYQRPQSMRIIVHDVSHIFSNAITSTVPICMHLFSPIILLLSILRLSMQRANTAICSYSYLLILLILSFTIWNALWNLCH